MNQLRFADLLEKFLNETISSEELGIFLTMVKKYKDDVLIQDTILEKLQSAAYTGLSEQGRWQELYQQTLLKARGKQEMKAEEAVDNKVKWLNGENETRRLRLISLWTRTAVAAFTIILLGAGIYILTNHNHQPKKDVAGVTDWGKPAGYARYIMLPDSSSVVLNAGSTLEFPDAFNTSREVKLKGEAYFDVKKDVDKPFIIYTGSVKTTVLGTAFNIKAYPLTSKITISVSSGKVKVEDKKKVLAVLDKDQQVVYNVPEEAAQQETVNVHDIVTDWTMRDMVFEEVSFESVAQSLGRRYGVTIEFKNPAMKTCTIKASFSGTESLQNVLDILSTISNSSYVVENGKYVILGEGCM
jgi:transmembrane sensor